MLIPVYLWAKESMGKIRGGTEGIFRIRIQKNGCRAAWQMRGWARGGEACVCGQHRFGLAGGGVRSYKQGQDGPRALVTASGGDPDLDQTEMSALTEGEQKLGHGEEAFKGNVGLALATYLLCGDNVVVVSSQVQIQNKKVDISKVSSKCGSKANIKHKPGEWCLPCPRTPGRVVLPWAGRVSPLHLRHSVKIPGATPAQDTAMARCSLQSLSGMGIGH